MTTSKIKYNGNLRTTAIHYQSKNEIITDAPIDNHGKGEAFSPTDMASTSLACCMLTIIGINANEYGYSIDGTTAEITKIMESNPRRIGEIVVEFTFPKNNYSDKEKKLIEASAKTCPVAKSLHPELKQTIVFNY